MTKISGAYVQVWAWVELSEPTTSSEVSDSHFRELAGVKYGEEGQIEIDPDSKVSRAE